VALAGGGAHLLESFGVVSRRFVDNLGDDVDRRQHDADGRVERRSLGVVALAATRVDRRDAVPHHRNVLQTPHLPTDGPILSRRRDNNLPLFTTPTS